MQRMVIPLLLLVLLQTACVSHKEFAALQSDCSAQLTRMQEKQREVDASLRAAEAARKAQTAEIVRLEEALQRAREQRHSAADRILQLEAALEKKASIIELQEDVLHRTDSTRKKIERELQEQISRQEIKLAEMEGQLKVTFVDKILFNTGSAVINAGGRKVLEKIAPLLKEQAADMIRVAGHTDNVPIGPALREKYPTNWELSTARATAVVRFLQEQSAIAPQRLSACGYSYYQPAAANDTASNRRRNRRIEIILAPRRLPR